MENKILEMCLVGMSAYKKAATLMELGEASDIMADAIEEIMLIVADRNPEVADKVDEYFSEKEGAASYFQKP